MGHFNGAVTPNDEPAVAIAKAEHFAAGGGQALGPIGIAAAPAPAITYAAAPAVAAVYGGYAAGAPAYGGYAGIGYAGAVAPIGAGLPTPLDVAGQPYPAAEPYLHDASGDAGGDASPAAEAYVHDASGDAGGDDAPAAIEYVHEEIPAEEYVHDLSGEAYPAAEPYLEPIALAAAPAIGAIGYGAGYGAIAGGAIAAALVAVTQTVAAPAVTRVAHQTSLVGVQRNVVAGPIVAGAHGAAAIGGYAAAAPAYAGWTGALAAPAAIHHEW